MRMYAKTNGIFMLIQGKRVRIKGEISSDLPKKTRLVPRGFMSVGLRLFLGEAQLGIDLFKPNINIAVGGELGKKKSDFIC